MSTVASELHHQVVGSDIPSLRRRLDGAWALLFSHVDDFSVQGFEADRWLAHVRAAFASTNVRPLAGATDAYEHSTSWVVEAGGAAVCMNLEDIRHILLREEGSECMREAALDSRVRFVILLDHQARVRWSYLYQPEQQPPSPIDLARLAESKRLEALEADQRKWGKMSPFPRWPVGQLTVRAESHGLPTQPPTPHGFDTSLNSSISSTRLDAPS